MPREEKVGNMPYDEALELSQDSEEPQRKEEKLTNEIFDEAHELDDSEQSVETTSEKNKKAEPKVAAPVATTEATSESEESDEASASASAAPRKIEGQYDPQDYKDLDATSEVRDLFQYITRYAPHDVELDSTLKCFVPELIPAVGEMDPFIKVPRPDARRDNLGVTVLDEPAAAQSDATVLELQLRAVSKKQHGDLAVRSIDNAAKSPLEIDRWIASIADLHRAKPQTQVNYRKPMPDLDALMAEWPPALEDRLKDIVLPDADIDLSLPEFARLACALLDVPVYDNLVESLHLLFSLYLEFAENAHFKATQQPPDTATTAK
ncbi:hypothetical protein CTAYLR_005527 [Chrysophaeum taylorii]|uniref:Intraflagellar transport protein 46 homolog n=1 Tax=Chrysophaeum taylorii TaxID=2483200 RepID=A0AAD7XJ98_9STRA|nr:hypothetical protein CTAYLR_005527 [Chrysophaeum taylorii]